jgi:signal transduction histidine kinase
VSEAGGLSRPVSALRQLFTRPQARVASGGLLDLLEPAIVLFADRGLVYANRSAQRLLGPVREGDDPETALGMKALSDAVVEAGESGRPVAIEVERDGRNLVAWAATTARGESALIISDLTDLHRVEAMRRDFVTNASHELKTPVAGIQALAESAGLALDRDPDRVREMIERLQQEAARLAGLVEELLDLSRLEEAAPARTEPVDLAELARRQAARLASTASKRRVAVTVDAAEAATVVGLPDDLRLVVINLLQNAIQYNRPGGEVKVSVRKRDGLVVMEVADTGIGIAEEDRDRIFERFYRVDRARSRAGGGTGLGLSIVRHAVQRHGGSITVDSAPDQGSTFRVSLPVEGAGR